MTSPILLTGGTGTLGRLVLPLLQDAGRQVRLLSRDRCEPVDGVEHVTGDIGTGDGVDAAVAGIETIVHCAGAAKGDDDMARNLARAASRAGVRHLVFISVVGADRIPVVSGIDRAMYGYFAAKRDAERVIADSGVPWTTLRATQFHDWVLMLLGQMAKMPVMPLWGGARFQPVDSGEVAARLVELALDEPSGLVPDIAGPRVYRMEELARSYLRAVGKHRLMISPKAPGKGAAAYRAGANLAPERAVGRRTWEDFLAAQVRHDL
jgi:uncharacterized protein YbjT (DUF2867 family)